MLKEYAMELHKKYNQSPLLAESIASVDQAFAGAVYTAAAMVNAANTTNNTGNFEISHGTGTATVYSYAGDIELASKPTWAY